MTTTPIQRRIAWKDLVKLSNKEIIIENTITLPWLFASLALAYYEYYLLAFPCSVMFFLTALRQVHNGFHNALGTYKWATWISLFSNSVLMLSSAHAVQFTHLRHHKYCLGEKDHEGKCAKMKWWQAILYGPLHIYTIHRVGLTEGNKYYRKNILVELIAIAIFITIAFVFDIHFLIYHVIVMMGAEFLSAFFAVWTVHHDIEEQQVARTQRTGWKNFITYSMFYHLEHHLFPAVPTIKLPELARRLDEEVPELEKRETF